jgi:hypothetical protein
LRRGRMRADEMILEGTGSPVQSMQRTPVIVDSPLIAPLDKENPEPCGGIRGDQIGRMSIMCRVGRRLLGPGRDGYGWLWQWEFRVCQEVRS